MREVPEMRSVYLISYDVCDARRLRKVHKTMKGYGDPMQLSVFRCELSRLELQELKEKLWPHLNERFDRVILVDLGPVNGRGDACIEFWGTPLTLVGDRSATIV
jgi:CRISPR-associated protein Cas2